MDIDQAGHGATQALASFAANLEYDDLPDDVAQQCKRLLLDTIGCGLAGSATGIGRASVAWASSEGFPSHATILGSRAQVSAFAAACVNARMSGALSADETYPSAYQTSHHGSAIIWAAYALAERHRVSGSALLTAIAAGYEVGARMVMSMAPGADASAHGKGLRPGGWAPSSVVGSALAGASVLGLPPDRAAHAAGLAGLHADASTLKWFEVPVAPMVASHDGGWHSMTGVLSASMAAHGLTGYDTILDGATGLWKGLSYEGCEYDVMLGGLGERWYTMDAAFKWWPCQHWMHQCLTALQRLVDEHRFDPADVDRVVLRTNFRSSAPRFLQQDPPAQIERSFNLPHAAAMVLLGVEPGLRWSDDAYASDPVVASLRTRVEVEIDPETEEYRRWVVDHQIREMPASASVWAAGKEHRAEVRYGLGDPWSQETRLSDEQLADKFRSMVAGLGRDGSTLWDTRVESIIEEVMSLDTAEQLSSLSAMLTGEGPV